MPDTDPCNELFFCGNTEKISLDRRHKWMNRGDSGRPITWWFEGGMSRIPTPRILLAIKRACKQWGDECGIHFKQASGDRDADILIITKRLDGSGGTLADAQLPQGNNKRLLMRLDDEAYVLTDSPNTGRSIDLGRVLLHELGHTIGIGHLNSGNVMQPSYGQFTSLQKDDIKSSLFLYGKDVPDDPPDPPDPPSEKDIVIVVPAGATITISQKGNS